MAQQESAGFLAGVIEGFYGQPWTPAERFELFDWMAAWGLNTYLYAPKDDLKQRAIWREPYSAAEGVVLEAVIRGCHQRKLQFIYALSPGLDIRYTKGAELDRLRARFAQLLAWGCPHFALLFDDIPDQMDPLDLTRCGSLAAAQCQVANALFRWVRERAPDARFLFCPTPYCGRMAQRHHGGEGYLATVGRELLPEIDIFWAGPEIIAREITVPHGRELQAVLRRPPLIWDNLHANDYDGRRFYCGPYAGRPLELRREVSGLLVNPNNEFELNFVPLRTLAEFVRAGDAWDARQAYLAAMQEWLPRFATVGKPVCLKDLVLFGDCYYLPYDDGPGAAALYDSVRELLLANPTVWGARAAAVCEPVARLREFCARMAELRHRPLFHALHRRVWELREELDLLQGYIRARAADPETPCRSDFHQPHTYRGGLVPRLRRLLTLQPDGTFTPTIDPARSITASPP